MIVAEKISGTIFRLHLDPDNPQPDAQWFLTDDGKIKGLLVRDKATPAGYREFRKWEEAHELDIEGFDASVESVAKVMARFGFKEYVREGKNADR